MQDSAISRGRDPFQLPPEKERTLSVLCGDGTRCALKDVIRRYEEADRIGRKTGSEITAFEAGKHCAESAALWRRTHLNSVCPQENYCC